MISYSREQDVFVLSVRENDRQQDNRPRPLSAETTFSCGGAGRRRSAWISPRIDRLWMTLAYKSDCTSRPLKGHGHLLPSEAKMQWVNHRSLTMRLGSSSQVYFSSMTTASWFSEAALNAYFWSLKKIKIKNILLERFKYWKNATSQTGPVELALKRLDLCCSYHHEKQKWGTRSHTDKKPHLCDCRWRCEQSFIVTLHSRRYLNSIRPDEAPSKSEYDNLSLFAKPYRLFFFFLREMKAADPHLWHT